MQLAVTTEQALVVTHLLEQAVNDVRIEIRHTHESDVREALRYRERLLRDVLDRLAGHAEKEALSVVR